MTEKLKVSRYVADAIESLRKHESDDELMKDHADAIINGNSWTINMAVLNEVSLLEMANILTNGYEVEMTPHEEIAQLYKYHYPKAEKIGNLSEISFSRGYVEGVKFTLEKLDITIKGVNDK